VARADVRGLIPGPIVGNQLQVVTKAISTTSSPSRNKWKKACMWRIAGGVILVLGGLYWIYHIGSTQADRPYWTHAQRLTAAAPGLVSVVVGVGQSLKSRWAWSNTMWLIAGSVVLILSGCLWIFFWFAVSVVVGADSRGAPVPGLLSKFTSIGAPGLIPIVGGVGQLIWK
jgi:hypothetical protein